MKGSIVPILAATLSLVLGGELAAGTLIDFETPSLGVSSRQIIDPFFTPGIFFDTPPGDVVDAVVGLVRNDATSVCVEPSSPNQKLGTGRRAFADGSIGRSSFPIAANFEPNLGAPATVAVDFQTLLGYRVRLRLFDAQGNLLGQGIQTAGPAAGTCGFPGSPRAKATVTATAGLPVAKAIMDLADTSSIVFVIDNFRVVSTGPNVVLHEPVLLFESAGGFIIGGHHEMLTVYNDGSAIYSKLTGPNPAGNFCDTGVPKSRVDQLRADLSQAHAMQLRDQLSGVTDVPLQTVTVFDYPPTAPRGVTNTFSYELATGNKAPIDAIIRAFLAEVFPNC